MVPKEPVTKCWVCCRCRCSCCRFFTSSACCFDRRRCRKRQQISILLWRRFVLLLFAAKLFVDGFVEDGDAEHGFLSGSCDADREDCARAVFCEERIERPQDARGKREVSNVNKGRDVLAAVMPKGKTLAYHTEVRKDLNVESAKFSLATETVAKGLHRGSLHANISETSLVPLINEQGEKE
jgi:hypothetical protein